MPSKELDAGSSRMRTRSSTKEKRDVDEANNYDNSSFDEQDPDVANPEEDVSDFEDARPRKRRKVAMTTSGDSSGRPRKSAVGQKKLTAKAATSPAARRSEEKLQSLQLLLDMPLDIIFDVLSHLKPLDLLHLSQTNKNLHGLLTSRSSQHVWRAAWANVENLPPYPEGVFAPALTAVISDTSCQKCHKQKCNNLTYYWICMAKYCKKCVHRFHQYKYNWDDIEYGVHYEKYPLGYVLPAFEPYMSVYENHLKIINRIVVRMDDLIDFVSAWRQVPIEDRKRFLQQRKKAMDKRRKHAKLCEDWWKRQRS